MDIVRVPNPAKADGKPTVLSTSFSVQVSHAVVITAKVSIQRFDPMTVDGYKASSSDPSTFGKMVGIALDGASPAQPVPVLVSGRIENNGWAWVEGDLIFLSGAALNSSAPSVGYIQQVGKADTSSSIILAITSPIQL